MFIAVSSDPAYTKRGIVRAMPARPVELRIGGQSYRVVSSASAEELERLAAVVDDKLSTIVPPGRAMTPQAMLLVAMALAHDVEAEKRKVAALREQSRASLAELVHELDVTLAFASDAIDKHAGSARGSEVAHVSSSAAGRSGAAAQLTHSAGFVSGETSSSGT